MAPILQVIGAATVVLLPIIFDVATINIIIIVIIEAKQGEAGGMMGPRYKRLQGGSAHFSRHTNRQTLHIIIIYIYISSS